MSRVKDTFPEGWVGMELSVDGQDWAVLKPIGHTGDAKAGESVVVECLFDQDRKENHYSEFMDHLRNSMMSGLEANSPPNIDKPYDWRQLLAWLTRDQEARFQSLHDWRSPRSGSDTPKFQKPKEHALYLIRLVLGLVQDKELKLSRKMTTDDRELTQHETRIAELRREPEYRFNEQERALKQLLGLSPGEMLNVDESDCTSPVYIKRSETENAISTLQSDIEHLDQNIAQKHIWLASYDEQRRAFHDAMEATEEATEDPGDESPEDETIRQLRALRGRDCTYGNVSISECSYVRRRIAEAESKIIDLQKEGEDQRVASESERRLIILEQQRKDHDEVVALLTILREKLNKDVTAKQGKERELSNFHAQLQRLDYHLGQRKAALDLIEGRAPNTELQRLSERATNLRAGIEEQGKVLEDLMGSYDQRLKAIRKIYNSLIVNALSKTYSGKLRMPKGELQFHIDEATGLSGEAVETLALVLADVAAMECSCKGIGHHPRFLLHDSPREADLDRHIYNRYLLSMWSLTEEHGGQDVAPFQYIVTTTSRPPDNLKPAICLQLEAHPASKMLFGCLLKNVETPSTPDLFAGEGVME